MTIKFDMPSFLIQVSWLVSNPSYMAGTYRVVSLAKIKCKRGGQIDSAL